MKCKWDKAWIGLCGEATTGDNTMCDEHMMETCVSCGAQATHECDETGQFVCGFPLCDDCEHSISPAGDNGGIGFYSTLAPGQKAHVKKTEQTYKPWYSR